MTIDFWAIDQLTLAAFALLKLMAIILGIIFTGLLSIACVDETISTITRFRDRYRK